MCITAMGFKNRRRTGIVTLTNAARVPEHQHLSYIRHEHPQLRHQNRLSVSYGPRPGVLVVSASSSSDRHAGGQQGAACSLWLEEKEKLLTWEDQATEVTDQWTGVCPSPRAWA